MLSPITQIRRHTLVTIRASFSLTVIVREAFSVLSLPRSPAGPATQQPRLVVNQVSEEYQYVPKRVPRDILDMYLTRLGCASLCKKY
jgi:hypothetical protein